MAKRLRRVKPILPEPSARFCMWSGVVSAALIIALLLFDLVSGWAR
jgi:hypothetical protein